MKGCGASGNSCRAVVRSPPCSRRGSGREIMAVALTALAVLIEIIVGYPRWLLRSIRHPVMWMGRFIAILERSWNNGSAGRTLRQTLGVVTVFLLVVIVAMAALVIERGLLILPFGMIGAGILGSTLIAQRSLHQHVARVADALENEGIRSAREAVSHLVGRDTHSLDEAGDARAAIESLAGPRAYGGVLIDDAFMGDGRRAARTTDIRAALALYRRADAILVGFVILMAAALIAIG